MWWSTFGILTFPVRSQWESMAHRQTLQRIGSNTAATIKWHLISWCAVIISCYVGLKVMIIGDTPSCYMSASLLPLLCSHLSRRGCCVPCIQQEVDNCDRSQSRSFYDTERELQGSSGRKITGIEDLLKKRICSLCSIKIMSKSNNNTTIKFQIKICCFETICTLTVNYLEPVLQIIFVDCQPPASHHWTLPLIDYWCRFHHWQ